MQNLVDSSCCNVHTVVASHSCMDPTVFRDGCITFPHQPMAHVMIICMCRHLRLVIKVLFLLRQCQLLLYMILKCLRVFGVLDYILQANITVELNDHRYQQVMIKSILSVRSTRGGLKNLA